MRRRHVYGVAAAYIVVGLGVLGAAELVLDPLGLGAMRPFAVVLTLLGFPLALVLAWAYEVRPDEPAPAEVGAGTDRDGIVVLPFDNMSPDPGDAYFSDGLTEEVITHLSRVRSLRVISRSSAMALKNTEKDVRAIGRELGVQYVLEGSVRKAGDHLRITAQLIDARTDEHLWSKRYDGTLDDIFQIQEQTSRAIVDALDLTLMPDEDRGIGERAIDDPKAYACYLQATQDIYRASATSLRRAVQLVQNGLEIVGENELLLSTMGEAYVAQLLWGVESDRAVLENAERCAERVFELDPESTHGVRLSAMIQYHRGNRAEAARLFKRALSANPDDVNALTWLVSLYARAGKAAPARGFVEHLLDIDPLTPITHHWTGWLDFYEGMGTEALLPPFRKLYEMDPESPYTQWMYAYGLAYNGRVDEARPLLHRLSEGAPRTTFGRLAVVLDAALDHGRETPPDLVSDELERTARSDDATSWWLAECYSLMGRIDEVLECVDTMIRMGGVNYPALARSPLLENARRDSRFQEKMQQVKSLWEAFEE